MLIASAVTSSTPSDWRSAAATLAAIDDWRREQPDLPARGKAIRRLVEIGLAKGGKR